jgi:hypothetical protein
MGKNSGDRPDWVGLSGCGKTRKLPTNRMKNYSSGAEAQLILLTLSARLKPCPDTKPRIRGLFPQAVKPPIILLTLSARLKPPQRRGPVAWDPEKTVPLLQSPLG